MNRLRWSFELVGDSSEIVDRIEDSLEVHYIGENGYETRLEFRDVS